MRRRWLVPVAVGLALIGGCGSAEPAPGHADQVFLQDMIPHHERAIAVARIGEQHASDPRVLAFARRIVREQTPELTRMQARASDAHLQLNTALGARTALHRISDAQLTALSALRGVAFDRRFLALNIASEQGAAQMARAELAAGHDTGARDVAKGIASAPGSEIPQLQALLAQLA